MDELEKAHLDYEKRKQVVLYNLESISKNLTLCAEWINDAIEFIKEKEV